MANTSAQNNHYDVIILGAGMAGLACASRLLSHPRYIGHGSQPPLKRLRVLEARNRIGGRIASEYVNGSRLDTGANWIHGVGSEDSAAGVNPLMKILPDKKFRELKNMVAFKPFYAHEDDDIVASVTEDRTDAIITQSTISDDWVKISSTNKPSGSESQTGDLVIPAEVTGTLMRHLWGMIGNLHERGTSMSASEAKATTILAAIREDEDFRQAFETLPKEYHAALAGLPQFVENMEAGPLETRVSGESVEGRSEGLGMLEYQLEDFEGEQVFLRDGYTEVVEEVGKEVTRRGLVRLGMEVRRVQWEGEKVRVGCAEGEFTADTVVCTLPLGVLQHHLSRDEMESEEPFFVPHLPEEKTDAIRSLGYGTLDKIFMVYAHPWWRDEPFASILARGLSSEDEEEEEAEDKEKQANTTTTTTTLEPDNLWGFTPHLPGISILPTTTTTGPRALTLINLHALTGFPVLSCFVSCANAIHFESLSDAAVGDFLHETLTRWLGRQPPRPEAVHVTRWKGDEFSRGSYSHMVQGVSERGHRVEFGRAVGGGDGGGKGGRRLRFAGEHTSEEHFATVHGALLSGWREADAILREGGD